MQSSLLGLNKLPHDAYSCDVHMLAEPAALVGAPCRTRQTTARHVKATRRPGWKERQQGRLFAVLVKSRR